jgi:hypothetical protein
MLVNVLGIAGDVARPTSKYWLHAKNKIGIINRNKSPKMASQSEQRCGDKQA